MPLLRFQVAAQMDSTLPRDSLVNTLYFNDQGFTEDADGLCADLNAIFRSIWYLNPTQIVTTAYPVGAPPQYPVGRAETDVGSSPASSCPREVALCLSFYAERNLPRQRGRIYLPICGSTVSPSTARPNNDLMTRVLSLSDAFSDLGGIDVDWQVYSPTDGQGRNITNAWVDNEWDTIRSRGLRGSTRQMAAISE
jgi:hypothetical protein